MKKKLDEIIIREEVHNKNPIVILEWKEGLP